MLADHDCLSIRATRREAWTSSNCAADGSSFAPSTHFQTDDGFLINPNDRIREVISDNQTIVALGTSVLGNESYL